MSTYYIPSHVHFVSQRDTTVFMDLSSDRYTMLLGPEATAFQSMLSSSSDSQRPLTLLNNESDGTKTALTTRVLAHLKDYGLVTTDVEFASSRPRSNIDLPDEDLVDCQDTEPLHIHARDIRKFLTACSVAALRLKYTSIAATISILERRKQRKRAVRSCCIAEVRHLVHIYSALRPFFPKDSSCLFDSLSLLEFLARNHCFPDLIFAVRFDPWLAHCWVQYGNVALNQNRCEAYSYLPIMSV